MLASIQQRAPAFVANNTNGPSLPFHWHWYAILKYNAVEKVSWVGGSWDPPADAPLTRTPCGGYTPFPHSAQTPPCCVWPCAAQLPPCQYSTAWVGPGL